MEAPKANNLKISRFRQFWKASFNLPSPIDPKKQIRISVWDDTEEDLYDQIKYFLPIKKDERI